MRSCIVKLQIFALFALFELGQVSQVKAQDEILVCYLREIVSVTISGYIEDDPVWGQHKDEPIAVNRDTGAVDHSLFGNGFYPNLQLIDVGSQVSSFKVFAFSEQGLDDATYFRNSTYFEVQTYAQGDSMPFISVTNGLIGTGNCE